MHEHQMSEAEAKAFGNDARRNRPTIPAKSCPPQVVSASAGPLPEGVCVVPDHHKQTFVIEIQSLTPVDIDVLKRLIQEKYKVIGIHAADHMIIVK